MIYTPVQKRLPNISAAPSFSRDQITERNRWTPCFAWPPSMFLVSEVLCRREEIDRLRIGDLTSFQGSTVLISYSKTFVLRHLCLGGSIFDIVLASRHLSISSHLSWQIKPPLLSLYIRILFVSLCEEGWAFITLRRDTLTGLKLYAESMLHASIDKAAFPASVSILQEVTLFFPKQIGFYPKQKWILSVSAW